MMLSNSTVGKLLKSWEYKMRFTTCCFYFFSEWELENKKKYSSCGVCYFPRKKQRRCGDTQFIYWFLCGGGGLLWILFFNWTKSSLNCCLMCLFNYDTTTFARNKSPLSNDSKKHTYFTLLLQNGSLTLQQRTLSAFSCLFQLKLSSGIKITIHSVVLIWVAFLHTTFKVRVS